MSVSPLEAAMAAKLDPEYREFYNANLADKPGLHEIPWHPSIRNQPAQPGGSEPLKVGNVRDIRLETCSVRVFTPEGAPPTPGWPVFLFFHGGGWTLGNIGAENAFCSNICKRASVVVVSVDYRLGPEQPYPAAVEDAVLALKWLHKEGPTELGADINRLAVGGSSSGGNLAAILTHKAAQLKPSIPIVFQLLIVPVTDNTSELTGNPHKSWLDNRHAASLTPAKMMWFRKNYLPNPADWNKWDASPLLAPDDWFKGLPKAWIAVCDLDILRDEGLAYARRLQSAGVDVEVKNYQHAPHPIMAMDGYDQGSRYSTTYTLTSVISALQIGRQLVTDACQAVASAIGHPNNQ